jgi:hypothetical protein
VKALLETEHTLSKSVDELAAISELPTQIRAVVQRAQSTLPPAIDALLDKNDESAWPPNAMRFLLQCWALVATREALAALALMQDASIFDNKVELDKVLAIVGLDIALDDSEIAQLRARFR